MALGGRGKRNPRPRHRGEFLVNGGGECFRDGRRRGLLTQRSQREEHREHREKRRREKQKKKTEEKQKRDPSTARPDAPNYGAEEKIGSLRSG